MLGRAAEEARAQAPQSSTTALRRGRKAIPEEKEPMTSSRALRQNCLNEARFRKFLRQRPSRMESVTWRRRPRTTSGMRFARRARSAACAARSQGCGSAKLSSRFRFRWGATQNEPMTLLASSHRHVADVGGPAAGYRDPTPGTALGRCVLHLWQAR